MVIFGAVDEPHHVGVLLDRARFAKVGQLGLLVLALFHRTAKLRQRDHRQLQLLGHGLEATADLRNLVHAVVVGAARALQQLQVVDHDEADLVLPLQPPCAHPQRIDGERGGVVDIERQVGETLARFGKPGELVAPDIARTQLFRADLRLFGKDTRRQLVRAHFEAEEGDRCAAAVRPAVAHLLQVFVRGVERDVGRERGLAHARTPGEDHEVGIVQTRGLVVDGREAGGAARQAAIRIHRLLRQLQRRDRGVFEGAGVGADVGALGNLVERGLGLLDLLERFDRFRRVERAAHQRAAHRHQFAQQREVVDLLRQLARCEESVTVRGQPREIGRPAERFEMLVTIEIGLERHRARGRPALHHGQHAFHDQAVRGDEEMLWPQGVGQFLVDRIVDQHRAKEGGLGLHVGGQRATFLANGGGGGVACGTGGGGIEDQTAIGHCPLLVRGGGGPQAIRPGEMPRPPVNIAHKR